MASPTLARTIRNRSRRPQIFPHPNNRTARLQVPLFFRGFSLAPRFSVGIFEVSSLSHVYLGATMEQQILERLRIISQTLNDLTAAVTDLAVVNAIHVAGMHGDRMPANAREWLASNVLGGPDGTKRVGPKGASMNRAATGAAIKLLKKQREEFANKVILLQGDISRSRENITHCEENIATFQYAIQSTDLSIQKLTKEQLCSDDCSPSPPSADCVGSALATPAKSPESSRGDSPQSPSVPSPHAERWIDPGIDCDADD